MRTMTFKYRAHKGKKKCTRCEQILPTSEFAFHAISIDGLQSYCRSCNNEAAEYWRKGEQDPFTWKHRAHDGVKRCTKCDEVKPVDAFYKLDRTYDGLHPYCKACENERKKIARERKKSA